MNVYSIQRLSKIADDGLQAVVDIVSIISRFESSILAPITHLQVVSCLLLGGGISTGE